jgi:YegS/Rv2252/BmrU family lipid kinase
VDQAHIQSLDRGMMGMNCLVLVNPVSSGGRGARVWSHIEPTMRNGHPRLQVHLTRGPDDAERVAGEWAAGGGTLLFVVGGDGTLHEAVNGLAGAGRLDAVRLAVIPAGTGNDFARSTGMRTGGLPWLDGGELRVDLGRLRFETPDGRARTRVFLNSASIGMSVRGNALAHRLRRRLPSAACYVLGGIGALLLERRARRPVVRLRVDGRLVYEGKALNLTAANGETFGSGLPIAPGASVRDGVLDHVVVGDVGSWGAMRAFLKLMRGTHLELASVRHTGGRTAEIEVDGTIALEADGYMLEGNGPIAIEILPAALRVACPMQVSVDPRAARTPPWPAPAAP